jgi:hypothetical protein
MAKLDDYNKTLNFHINICMDAYRKQGDDVSWQVVYNKENDSYNGIGGDLEYFAAFAVIRYMNGRGIESFINFKLATIPCDEKTKTLLLRIDCDEEDDDEQADCCECLSGCPCGCHVDDDLSVDK